MRSDDQMLFPLIAWNRIQTAAVLQESICALKGSTAGSNIRIIVRTQVSEEDLLLYAEEALILQVG